MTEKKRPSQLAAYADLFEKMSDPVLLLDPETLAIKDFNLSFELLLDKQQADLMGKDLLSWIDNSAKKGFLQAVRIAKRRYHPHLFGCVWRMEENRAMEMELVLCVLQLTNDEQVIQIIAKDVTALKNAEKKAENYLNELQSLNSKLEALSTTDEMTGLSNFRSFKNELQKTHEKAAAVGGTYSIVFCDVDHFKQYNDKNGHPAGDRLLKSLADILRKNCRGNDMPARYGGEEFTILCPGTAADGALIVANRLRVAVETHDFEFGERQPLGKVTVSIGVATYPNAGKSDADVLKAADEALYVSKQSGRNTVTNASNIKKKAA